MSEKQSPVDDFSTDCVHTAESVLANHFETKKSKIYRLYTKMDKEKKGFITWKDLYHTLKLYGLDLEKNQEWNRIIQPLFEKSAETKPKIISAPTLKSTNSVDDFDDFADSFLASKSVEDELGQHRLEFDTFFSFIESQDNNIIHRAFSNKLAVPNWGQFCSQIREIFEQVKSNSCGKNADYIPQLAEVNPNLYGLSLCTVDGQRFSIGDYNIDFTIQSCGKAFAYCIACEDLGVETVHKHVGYEPSGVAFNYFTLDANKLPHNPMINSGAISVTALIKNEEKLAKRFTYIQDKFSEFAGCQVGFSNSVFISEKDTADKNFAIAYYMKEAGVYPKGTKIQDILDLYFQICSINVNCKSLSVMAATLANGGVNPLTNKKLLSQNTVKSVLQLMYSAGMYDYSGEWSVNVGLPAKSGVSGAVCLVIPGTLGLCIYSPRLDERGNSVRGVEFCMRANRRFKWSIFDRLVRTEEGEEMTDLKRNSLNSRNMEKEQNSESMEGKRKFEADENNVEIKKRKL